MSALRKQLEADLAIRGMSERTREAYVGAVAALAKHYGRPPDRIGRDEIQRYLLYLLTERKLAEEGIVTPFSAAELGSIVSALGSGLILQYYLEPDAVDPELLPRALRQLLGLPQREPRPTPDRDSRRRDAP